MTTRRVDRTITGSNTFSDRVQLVGYFNVSISGDWDATVTVQRSFDKGSTWYDVNQWDANTQEYGFEPERDVWYQIGIKDGDYTVGSVVVRLSQ